MTIESIGDIIRKARKAQGLTQSELALIANTATRYISDLENGKPSCQIGKALQVMASLGIQVELHLPENES